MLPGTWRVAPRTFQAFPKTLTEHLHALADGFLTHRPRTPREPRAKVGKVFVEDQVEPFGILVFIAAGDFDEVDRSMRFAAN